MKTKMEKIQKMDGELLFTEYTNNLIDLVSNGSLDSGEKRKEISDYVDILRLEILKRLSKNNIEEFKKRLIEEIEKDIKKQNIYLIKRMEGLGTVNKVREGYIKNLINNLK